MRLTTLLLLCMATCHCGAQILKDTGAQEKWSLHVQATVIPQYHFDFGAAYTGNNSLQTSEGVKTSITNTYYIGRKLWRNAAIYVNPEIAGGEGLSAATGIAGFPNGETFRIGSPKLKLYLARLYLEQKFAFDKNTELVEDGQNQLREHSPTKYLSVRVGKFSLADFFDDNSYSHDPRTDFMNWSLMSSGGWDYPANTRGYTNGFILELHEPGWAIRGSMVQVPEEANGQVMDSHLKDAFGTVLEAEKKFVINAKQNMVFRLAGFYNKARMGSYDLAIQEAAAQSVPPDVTTTRMYSRDKKGIYINGEYNMPGGGFFMRASYNDGINETWAFTEIDQSLSVGASFDGSKWKRPGDKWGLAYVLNDISNPHRNYLAAGGYGFIIGDGKLNHAGEHIFEAFYSFHVPVKILHIYISPDYQFVLHPAYNKDRGPVHIVALRAHFEL